MGHKFHAYSTRRHTSTHDSGQFFLIWLKNKKSLHSINNSEQSLVYLSIIEFKNFLKKNLLGKKLTIQKFDK